jgi:hypothetical protein
MNEILKWLGEYSLPVVILIGIGGGFLFVFQKAAEKAVAQAFDRHAKALELRLARRSAFEEKLLTDRYAALVELNGRLDQFMTILNRIRSGQPAPKGFYATSRRDGSREIVPLTAIYEQIEAKRLTLAEEFHELLYEKARLALQAAQLGPDPEAWDAHAQKWVDVQQRIYQSARKVFMLDEIKW